MERYDIAIIGTGPAGLEAAITAKVRNKNIILIGSSKLSTKVEKAHTVRNYLGLIDIAGEDMQKVFLKQLEALDIDITEDRVNTVYAMGDYFAIEGHNSMYEAKTVILACGMAAARTFTGELENLGRGVSYCATCDGSLYKGKSTVVIGYSAEEEKEADFLAEIAEEVIYIPMYKLEHPVDERIKVMEAVKPLSIEKRDKKVILNLEDKDKATQNIETDCVFILRESVAPTQLVPGMAVENNQVVVDRTLATNIKGLFACGDITGAPYQYIKAAGEGNVAALSAVNYLAAIDKK